MTAKISAAIVGLSVMLPCAAQDGRRLDPTETEVWAAEPRGVVPGASAGAPSDAIVLFDGKDLREWGPAASPANPADWVVAGGVFSVRPRSGDIQTRRLFTDYQLHLEWRVPASLSGSGQARGNSGLFLASTGVDSGYELQILDCAGNKTYANGQAASIYKQHIPLVNACAAAGEWQTYDVIWTAPRFSADGALVSPAYVTALHNGVLVQNHVALRGESVYAGKPSYRRHGPAPIKLQDHGDAVSFRNIWVRPL
ncbi:3-keto-disaccharide hydrolase [Massilia niastensis]|uniref:3-keto-disaccharide hydrolase n=1 Tax=Massilia niastensis TaxID=544911 RepID=UPI0003A18D7A|nr:DUF1080 domain-containing protein [Massilia niastensis]